MAVSALEKILFKLPHNTSPVFVGKYNDHNLYLGRYSVTTAISMNTSTKVTDYFPIDSQYILGIWGAIYGSQNSIILGCMEGAIIGRTLNIKQWATSYTAEYVIWYLYTDYEVH